MAISKIKTNSIANDAITSDKLATGGIATVDMADGSVTSLKILDGAIATADIADSAITSVKLDSAGISATFAAGAVGTPSITTVGDTNTGIFFPAADTIGFAEGGAEAMRIDSSGNLGIGTSSPSAKFQTNSTDGTIAIFRTTSGANNGRLNIDISDSAATAGFAVGGNSSFPAMTFANGGAERMRIDSSGNVGIGTASPSARVDVRTAALGTALQLSDDTNYGANFIGISGGLKLAMNGTQTFAIFQSTNERMRIDSSGNVGIGTSSPASKLEVAGLTNITAGGIKVTGSPTGYTNEISLGGATANSSYAVSTTGTGTPSMFFDHRGTSNTGAFYFRTGTTATTNRMVIDSSGNLQFNSGYGSAATAYGCRAWVNFNGTGTVAIRASGNVSSITDNGTGDYTVNFTTAMPDANYTAVGNCSTNSSFSVQFVSMFVSAVSNSIVAPTTSAFRMSTREAGGSGRDAEYAIVSVFR